MVKARYWIIPPFTNRSTPRERMLSTMRKVCFSSSRIIRPLVNSTDILVRGAHQAKAQAPNATVNISEHDLKLVNGEENFQFFYTCISVLSLELIRLGSSVTFFFVLTKGEHSRAPCVSQLT